MVTPELLQFVRSKRGEGISFQEIEERLLKESWSINDIKKARKIIISEKTKKIWSFNFIIPLYLFLFLIIYFLWGYTPLGRDSCEIICFPPPIVVIAFPVIFIAIVHTIMVIDIFILVRWDKKKAFWTIFLISVLFIFFIFLIFLF